MLLDYVTELKIVKKAKDKEKNAPENPRKWILTLPKHVLGPIDDQTTILGPEMEMCPQTDQLLTKSCVPSGLSWIAELKTEVWEAIHRVWGD